MQRNLPTCLDLQRLELEETVYQKQAEQKKDHTCRHEFFIGQLNLRDGPRWLQGTIEQKGPLSYLVQWSSGTVLMRHIDHILESVDSSQDKPATPNPVTPEPEELPGLPLPPSTPVDVILSSAVPVTEQSAISTDEASVSELAPVITDHQPESVRTPPRHYPQRQHHPPE